MLYESCMLITMHVWLYVTQNLRSGSVAMVKNVAARFDSNQRFNMIRIRSQILAENAYD